MGTVPTQDALVTGGLEVHGDSARLLTNASVTAYDHSAAISLARGGEVLVCATSQFHLLHSGTENSLLFGLDRGAIEIHSSSSPQDVILTPDIRFTLEHPGHYDLRLRVTPNGDTCVENTGTSAPVLSLADPFSGASYRLIPGQHVLFEHGSLREVVDNERSPCGCPPAPPPPVQQLASHSLLEPRANPPLPSLPPSIPSRSLPAKASHPLLHPPCTHPPPAKSTPRSLPSSPTTPPTPTPRRPAPSSPRSPLQLPAQPPAPPTGTGNSTSATPPPTPPGAHDIFHSIGLFFHTIFHPHSNPTPVPSAPSPPSS